MSLVKNTIELECLIQSLQDAISAKVEHDNARDSYDGYSWGYHGHSYVKKMEESAYDFGERLERLIEKRAEEIINRKLLK